MNKIVIKKQEVPDYIFEFFFLFFPAIQPIINYVANMLGIRDYSFIFVIILVSMIVALGRKEFSKAIGLKDILFYLLTALVFVMSWYFFPLNRDVVEDNALSFFLTILPFYFVGLVVGNATIRSDRLFLLSRITIIFILFLFFSHDTTEKNMGLAYRLLPVLMTTSYSVIKGQKIDIIFMLVGIGTLLGCAVRGPILLYLLFIIIIEVVRGKKWRYVGLLLLIGIASIKTTREYIVNKIRVLFVDNNINTRVIDYILNGNLYNDNGRSALLKEVKKMIREHPWQGNGIYADRRATAAVSWVRVNHEYGIYSHNIYYELICQYGYIIGILFLICLTWLLIQAILKANEKQRVVLTILILCYFLKLFVSSSYLLEAGFYAMLGLSISILRKHKEHTIKLRY